MSSLINVINCYSLLLIIFSQLVTINGDYNEKSTDIRSVADDLITTGLNKNLSPPSSSSTSSSSGSSSSSSLSVPSANNNEWSCEQLDFCNDKLGFEAIRLLHRQLDDDANGNVDISESDEFLRDELKYENSQERHKAFHGNDKSISVDELWKSWIISDVHNWTVEQTCEWLDVYVELPQYVDLFKSHHVDGTALPRLASSGQQLALALGIKDAIHRQKIALKAMDIVLFGSPKKHNIIKDILLAFSAVIAIAGLWFAYVQNKRSQAQLRKMLVDMDSLQKAEEQLTELQHELYKAQQEQRKVASEKETLEEKLKATRLPDSCSINPSNTLTGVDEAINHSYDIHRIYALEDELIEVKMQLSRAEEALSSKSWIPPQKLQQYLKFTYDKESKHFEIKRRAATFQLETAKKACEKLKKTRSSFFGSFRVAHGSIIDDVDSRILQAKASLAEVTQEIQERTYRWREIELLCGFHITSSSFNSSLATSATSVLTRNNSECTIHDMDDFNSSIHTYNTSSPSTFSMSVTRGSRHGELPQSSSSTPLTSCGSQSRAQAKHLTLGENLSEGDSNDEEVILDSGNCNHPLSVIQSQTQPQVFDVKPVFIVGEFPSIAENVIAAPVTATCKNVSLIYGEKEPISIPDSPIKKSSINDKQHQQVNNSEILINGGSGKKRFLPQSESCQNFINHEPSLVLKKDRSSNDIPNYSLANAKSSDDSNISNSNNYTCVNNKRNQLLQLKSSSLDTRENLDGHAVDADGQPLADEKRRRPASLYLSSGSESTTASITSIVSASRKKKAFSFLGLRKRKTMSQDSS